MRSLRLASSLLLAALLVAPLAQAQTEAYTLPELVDELSRDPNAPGAIDAVLAQLGRNPAAAAILSGEQKAKLREAIARGIREGKTDGLEFAPAMTVPEMGAAVRVAPLLTGTGNGATTTGQTGSNQTNQGGGLPLPTRAVEEDLGIPVADRSLPPEESTPVGPLGGLGVSRGGERDPGRAERGPDSIRLAAVLNRLSLNPRGAPTYVVRVGETRCETPQAVIAALQAQGHSVVVQDLRRTANFADLRHKDRSVAAPVWIDTELNVPGTDRSLMVPATHSEHQLLVRGPVVNADLAFFMGIEGEAKFRAMLGKDEAWTGGRVAHRYEGDKALEAVRVAGEVRRAFVEKQKEHPELPYGGYFNLGVCNDSNAFIEQALNGKTTLYPLTRDPRFYTGDGEIDRLSRLMPIDGRGRPADLSRVLASLPMERTEDLAFDSLRADVARMNGAAATGQTNQGPTGPSQGMVDQLPEQQRQR
jgi:hypothetical protein